MNKKDRKTSKTHDMHVRLTEHDWQRLRFAAEAEKRTVSNYVMNIVTSYLDNFENHYRGKGNG